MLPVQLSTCRVKHHIHILNSTLQSSWTSSISREVTESNKDTDANEKNALCSQRRSSSNRRTSHGALSTWPWLLILFFLEKRLTQVTRVEATSTRVQTHIYTHTHTHAHIYSHTHVSSHGAIIHIAITRLPRPRFHYQFTDKSLPDPPASPGSQLAFPWTDRPRSHLRRRGRPPRRGSSARNYATLATRKSASAEGAYFKLAPRGCTTTSSTVGVYL